MTNIFDIFKNNKKDKLSHAGRWDEIKPILEPYKRQAWIPKVTEKKSGPTASKFSGVPALSHNESWPCCTNCEQPMQLFLQLNSKDLPESVRGTFGEGFLQVFYCTNSEKECEVDCEAFFPFSKSTLVRVVNYTADIILSPESSPVTDAFPEKQIVGWEAKEDYPNWEELQNLGCTLSDEQSDLLCELGYPQPKDKLLGWPYWVQGVEYPDCPECGKPMKLVFQIDSEDNLPYMFGDVGCSHVTQCEQHPDRMAIAWACS